MGAVTPPFRPVGPCPFGMEHASKPFSRPLSVGAAVATFAQVRAAAAPFEAVRLHYLNNGAEVSGVSAIIAPSARLSNGYSPLDPASQAQAWTAATAAGSATWTIPAGSESGSDETYGILSTDWTYLRSYDRTDGAGGLPLVMVRTYSANALPALAPGTTDLAQWATINQGYTVQSYVKLSTDAVSDPSLFVSPTGSSLVIPAIIEFRYRKRGLSVMAIGGSNFQGLKTTSEHNPFGFQACAALSTQDLPVTWFNEGYASSTSANWLARFQALTAKLKFDVAIIATFTQNDPLTQAGADAAFGRAMEMAAYCIANNIVPILTTTTPWTASTSTTEAYRVGNNVKVRAMVASGFLVCDLDAAVTDGASPARMLPAYANVDGLHMNDAGNAVCATMELEPLLRKIVAVRPRSL